MDSKYLFILKSQELKSVLRHTLGAVERRENPSEHSWSMALMCFMYKDELEKEFSVSLDMIQMYEMCTVHDLVEILTDDASVWHPELRKDKAKLEEEAMNTLVAELPDKQKSRILELWHEFEAGETLESKIVRAFDRLSAPIQRIVTGQGWFEMDAHITDLDKLVLSRIEFSSFLMSFYDDIKKDALERKLIKE
jgi:putative hydrolases of HD superfamily